MRQCFSIAAIAICLTGCATTLSPTTGPSQVPWSYPRPEVRTAHVYLDDKLSSSTRVEAAKAVQDWNVALQGVLTLQVVQGIPTSLLDLQASRDCHDILIFAAQADDPMVLRSHVEHTTAITYPWGERPGALIYIVRHHDNTILHELGHALGAVDRQESGMLMTQEYTKSGVAYVDADAAAQVARWYH